MVYLECIFGDDVNIDRCNIYFCRSGFFVGIVYGGKSIGVFILWEDNCIEVSRVFNIFWFGLIVYNVWFR